MSLATSAPTARNDRHEPARIAHEVTKTGSNHGHLTLSIGDLDSRLGALRQGSFYWLMCDRADDAATLLRQTVAGLPSRTRAALVASAHIQRVLLASLAEQEGPGELLLLELPRARIATALKRLTSELDRCADMTGRLLLLQVPADGCAHLEETELCAWIDALRVWLARRNATLLLIVHGPAARLKTCLVRLNERLSGLAQLYWNQAGPRYLLHFWHNDLGVSGPREIPLREGVHGFAVQERRFLRDKEPSSGDQRLVLTQREVLEGARTVPEFWEVFDDLGSLQARTEQARFASVLFAVIASHQVEALAGLLHTLRETRGNALKLVVREVTPCLRYRDEHLLLVAGASLVIPAGTRLSRVLSLLGSIQGQLWQRSVIDDFDSLLQRLRPLPLCGLLSPQHFAGAVRQMWQDGRRCEISHQLVRLQLPPGLSPAQALGQSRLQRLGDIACIADGAIHLFLFACRADGVEPALDSLFRLPWQEVCLGYRLLVGPDALDSADFDDASQPPQNAPPAAGPATQPYTPLAPRQRALPIPRSPK